MINLTTNCVDWIVFHPWLLVMALDLLWSLAVENYKEKDSKQSKINSYSPLQSILI